MDIKPSEIPGTDAFTIEASLDERMAKIFSRWPDLVFPLPRGEDWLLIPDSDGEFASAVWQDDEVVPAGKFEKGKWVGVLTRNPGPGRPDVEAACRALDASIEKLIEPVRQWVDELDRIRSLQQQKGGAGAA